MAKQFRYPAKEYLQEIALLKNQTPKEPASAEKPDTKGAFTRLVDFVKVHQSKKNLKAVKSSKVAQAYQKTADEPDDLKKGLQVKKSV